MIILVRDCLMGCVVPGNYGQFELSYALTNNTGSADDFGLYLFADWDIAGPTSDSANLIEAPTDTRFMRILNIDTFDVLVEQQNGGGLFGSYAVDDAPSLLARLDNFVLNTYINTGLPYSLGDLATVWRPIEFLVPPGSTMEIPALTVTLGYSIFFDGFESGNVGAW